MHDGKKIVYLDPVNPEPSYIAKAGKIIRKNGIVIFPAKCLYGVAADALSEKAVQKVFNLKQRPLNNPILVLIPDRNMLKDLVKYIPRAAEKLMDEFWPGNITLVFKAKDSIHKLLTAGTGKIGVRIPSHPVARALVEYVKSPITGTSANLSGHNACNRTDRLSPFIIEHADLVLDAGILKGGTGSTIVDVTTTTIRILREGEISTDRINEILAS